METTKINVNEDVVNYGKGFLKEIELVKKAVKTDELKQEAETIIVRLNHEIQSIIETGVVTESINQFIQNARSFTQKVAVEFEAIKTKVSGKVMEILMTGVQSYIDDHVSYKVVEEKFDGYVLLDNGKVCPIFMNNTCSLNPLYVDAENKLHVSTWSTGNIISTRGFADLGQAVHNYNNQCSEYGNIIIDFHQF